MGRRLYPLVMPARTCCYGSGLPESADDGGLLVARAMERRLCQKEEAGIAAGPHRCRAPPWELVGCSRASPGPGETYHTTARLRAGWITLNGETVVLFGPDVSWW